MGTARTAVVTGAARGIGEAVARRLASEGHAVALLDLDQEACAAAAKTITELGGRALALRVDVSDEASVEAAVERVALDLGGPTILVNSAGVIRDNLLYKMTTQEFDTVLGVHVRGAFLLSRAVQSHMVEARWGRIVNLSSIAAFGNRGQANYSSAKAGLIGLSKTLAIELGPFGVTANAIAPGFVDTDMTRSTAQRIGVDYADFVSQAAAGIPVRRVGRPEDIAATVAFFASEEAGYVSGQVLGVAGGPTH